MTGVTMWRGRPTGRSEEGRSPEKLKGCRVRVQPESRKSVAEAGRRPPKADLEWRSSPAELPGRRTAETMKEWWVEVKVTG
jgi:hypothetical protein